MRIEDVEAVHAVYLYRSFISASEALVVPVSTLSKRVARVERELDLKLFDRNSSSNSVTPTISGGTILQLLGRLVSLYNTLLDKTREADDSASAKIAVGLTMLLAEEVQSRVLSKFLNVHPNVETIVIKKSQPDVLRMLQEGVLDCAFVLLMGSETENVSMLDTFVSDQFDFELMKSTSDLWIGVASDDPLAQKESVTSDDFLHRGIIMNKWHDNKARSGGEQYSFFKALDVDEADFLVYEEDFINVEYIYELVKRGVGLLPQAFKPAEAIAGVTFVRMEGWERQASLFFLARKHAPELVRSMQAIARDIDAS